MVVTSDVLGLSLVNDESNSYRAAQSTHMIDFKTRRPTADPISHKYKYLRPKYKYKKYKIQIKRQIQIQRVILYCNIQMRSITQCFTDENTAD